MYTYRQILKQALNIALKKRFLWFFGFFAALVGSTAELELLLSGSGFGTEGALFSFWQGLFEGGLFTLAGLKGIFSILFSSPIVLFTIALVFLVVIGISALVIWLVIISQSVLISQTVAISKNQPLSWRGAFDLGLTKFWPVIGLNALIRVIIWALLLILGGLALLKFPGASSFFIVGFDVFLVAVLILSFITKYAICGVVLKNQNFIDSLKSSWKIFKNNWLLSIEMAVILFLIYLVINSILVFVLFSIFLMALQLFAASSIILLLITLAIIAIFGIFQIVLTIFHWSTWTIIFELIATEKPAISSRLGAIFSKLKR